VAGAEDIAGSQVAADGFGGEASDGAGERANESALVVISDIQLEVFHVAKALGGVEIS